MSRRADPAELQAVAGLVAELQASGLTQRDIAAALGRSDRMVRFAGAGIKGANLRPGLEQLARDVGQRPAREAARTAAGRTISSRAAEVPRREAGGRVRNVKHSASGTTSYTRFTARASGADGINMLARGAAEGKQAFVAVNYTDAKGNERRAFLGKQDAAEWLRQLRQGAGFWFNLGHALAAAGYELDASSAILDVEVGTF